MDSFSANEIRSFSREHPVTASGKRHLLAALLFHTCLNQCKSSFDKDVCRVERPRAVSYDLQRPPRHCQNGRRVTLTGLEDSPCF